MIRFTMTFFLMIILFLGGVIVGFDQAGSGMNKLRGNDVESYDALQTVKTEDNQFGVEVLGQTFTQESIDEKREEYKEIKEDVFTEKLAFALEKIVKWFYNILIQGAYQISQLFY
ncbi:hypothetical protein HNQ94_002808 [Salirhabdus euzebyi]|uniref:DUF3679 domain-containing protein n=1 Tax=Salirhabdus euzebyi TaxID=394506 RepID=A0A841Q7M1_9BACI|nr:DUF3679 domain-containing protein [Salirhabdus euzebyi]MBB6454333.1 hypothetical protein [Salirhabdus euzebyi]